MDFTGVISCRVGPERHARIVARADAYGISVAAFYRTAIDALLADDTSTFDRGFFEGHTAGYTAAVERVLAITREGMRQVQQEYDAGLYTTPVRDFG